MDKNNLSWEAWYDQMEEEYRAMSEEEKGLWLQATVEGMCFDAIMQESWREDWEEHAAEIYRKHFGEEVVDLPTKGAREA